jgi:putative pyruvate formate lyase activating enzyme
MNESAAYLATHRSGALKEKAEALRAALSSCAICPHRCGVDRFSGERGVCRSGALPIVSSFGPHFGEEPVLVGRGGSGTIFFTNCNLGCIFCQNYDISHLGSGREVSARDLADMMLDLQERGCHNINFVTPTHMVYALLEALLIAVSRGLRIPLVYNSGGYDSATTLRLIEGIFDIYMPDFKYAWDETGRRLSGVPDYASRAREALAEMHAQVGDLEIDGRGIARRGLLVRHLVLPLDLAGSFEVLDFIRGLSPDTYLNIMDQYRPCFHARTVEGMGRMVTITEFDEVLRHARRLGLKRAVH